MVFSFAVEAQVSNTGSGGVVAAILTTTEHPDFVGVFVAWSGAVDVSGLADAGSHTWTKKGPTFSVYKVNGVALLRPINVAYFWTIASAALGGGGDAITATFTGAGATHSLLSAFAVSLPNVSLPFDTNVGLGYPSIQGLTNSAAFSVAFSTHLSHFATIAFTVLFPNPGGLAYGAGWTAENKGTATDFGWILESKIFTSIQTSAPASFVTASGNYTAITIVDAIEATDTTAYPVAEITGSEALPIDTQNSGEIKQSFDEVLPITNVDESLVIHDFTGTNPSGIVAIEEHKMKKNPFIDGSETNEYNGEQEFYNF